MKLQQKDYQVESNTSPIETASFECSFSEKAMAHAFEMQTVKLYAEPKYAAIREMVTNMIDSQERAGNSHLPILVTLPTEEDCSLTLQDQGTGMDFVDLKKCFMQFGESDKQDTNEEFGAFGWGSKSIICLSDIAHIDSIKDGILYQCVWYMTEKRLPRLDLLSKEATNLPNGTKIQVAVAKRDIQLIHTYIRRVGLFLEPGLLPTNELYELPVIIARNATDNNCDCWTNGKQKEDWIKVDGIDAFVYKKLYNSYNISYAITINGLLYGVNSELPNVYDYQTTVRNDKNEMICSLNILYTGDTPTIVIPFKIGELEFTTSRDAIKATPENKEKILNKLAAFAEQWIAYNKNAYENSKTLVDFFKLFAFDTNLFINYYRSSTPSLPIVENGKALKFEYPYQYELDIKPRFTRTQKLLNGLSQIEVVTNSVSQIVKSVSIRQACLLPVYIVSEKKKEATVIPEGLTDYIILTFKSFNSFFFLPHKIMQDLWHYPEVATKQLKSYSGNSKTIKEKKPAGLEYVLKKGLLKSAPLEKVKTWVYPYKYGTVVTELPKEEVFLYIDSKDNRIMHTTLNITLKEMGFSSIYITTPSIESSLPDTFIKLKDFINNQVEVLTKKYGLFAQVFYGNCVNINQTDFELAKTVAKKLRLNKEFSLLSRMQQDPAVNTLKIASLAHNDLDKFYSECFDNSSSKLTRRLNYTNLLVAATIHSKIKNIDKDKAKSIYEYLISTSGLNSYMYLTATPKVLASVLKR